MQADDLNRKKAREKFKFTDIAYLQSASFEPFLHQPKEDEEGKNENQTKLRI